MHIQLFPEEFIQLQLEIQNHPLLIQRLQKHSQLEVETIFAECCHYCKIEIDALLDGEQLRVLADKLRDKLLQMKVLPALNQNYH
jgi:hypothetical protein